MFTLEEAFITPALITVLILAAAHLYSRKAGKLLVKFVIPVLGMLIGYVLLSKLLLGSFLGHYGESAHTRFVFAEIVPQYFNYFIKYLLFLRYWDFRTQHKIYALLDQTYLFLPLFFACVFLLVCFILFYRRLPAPLKLAGVNLLFFFISLTPVINLYFSFLLYNENDRYGYIPSMFFSFFLILLFSQLPRSIFYLSAALCIILSGILLYRMTHWWKDQGDVFKSLANDFRWHDKGEVVILNVPDNFQGINMYRIYNAPSGFSEALKFYRRQKFEGIMYEVAQYNMMTAADGVTVNVDSADSLTVTFNQWGNWWWRSGIGASDYENESVRVRFEMNKYHLRFKKPRSNYAIIYQDGKEWKEVVMPAK